MKNKQFTCPVSMAVTEEQFNADLRQPLEKLGYRTFMTFDSPHLCNNFNGTDGLCKMTHFFKDHNRHFIDHYNPKLFLALASLTTESTETKEEVLARFEKGVERELIGYRFRNDDFNAYAHRIAYCKVGIIELKDNLYHFKNDYSIFSVLNDVNLLEIFCEPVYKEIETISISEAEKELKGFGREVKIDKDLK